MARLRGDWHPEYRLYNIFFVVAASPIGLGIFGAGLQYTLLLSGLDVALAYGI